MRRQVGMQGRHAQPVDERVEDAPTTLRGSAGGPAVTDLHEEPAAGPGTSSLTEVWAATLAGAYRSAATEAMLAILRETAGDFTIAAPLRVA